MASLFLRCACARETAARLNTWTAEWHLPAAASLPEEDLLAALHRSNFDLWHLEDQARDRYAADSAVASVKRGIDGVNQSRNDLTERIDEELLRHLHESRLPLANAPLHSETPGQMLDRLSILSLKMFHTEEELRRAGITVEHRQRNRQRLTLLTEQQNDLADCLSLLWTQVCAGEKRFKQYRQLKMYNDPDLNPVLYRVAERAPSV